LDAGTASAITRHAGETFRDCEDASCPVMVVIPPGRFRMGSPHSEQGHFGDEAPMHEVRIGYSFAAGKYPVTKGEWRAFVAATGRTDGQGCRWSDPGFAQDDSHAVVCVSWNDAQDYARWLTSKTGHHYRLLSEAEYEYVARAGTRTAFAWGATVRGHCRYSNAQGRAGFAYAPSAASYDGWASDDCRDIYEFTSPVGSFEPSPFGLHDTSGDVQSWTADCYHDSYRGAPADGSAWATGTACAARVIRGGSWNSLPAGLRVAARDSSTPTAGSDDVGLRVARTD
jgi:formylglycine-generating enzyme required for sulfatase activity